ncbi:hypothetical protein B484DRAFT_451266 [Ochromonadaceae sp. CCMP2298]|nr:hypothetical protein B484DRAFT_451266 [Ochromonadaceae sp. CCMP2298]
MWLLNVGLLLVVCVCLGQVSIAFKFSPLAPRQKHTQSLTRRDATKGSVEKVVLKLFLGNLPFTVHESEIEDHVSACVGRGVVKTISVPRGKKSKKGMGFAFIELIDPSEEVAQVVVKKLDGSDFNGRTLNSNLKDVFGDPTVKKEKRIVENSVYLSNLDYSFTEADLILMCDDILGPGLVASVEQPLDLDSGSPRGFAFIEFKSQETVEKALAELNCLSVYDRLLSCVPLNAPATPARKPSLDECMLDENSNERSWQS